MYGASSIRTSTNTYNSQNDNNSRHSAADFPTGETTCCQYSSEALVLAQVAPLARRQVAELDAADADALEAGDFQADQLAHAADLALLAFAQDKAQLVLVLPAHLGRLQRLAVEREAVVEQLEAFSVEPALDAHQVFLLDARVLADEQLGDAAVLGQRQESGGVDVEAPGRGETLQLGRAEAQRRLVAGVVGGGADLAGGFPTSEIALAAWDRWVEAMANHYKGKVRDWAMWNEPDINKKHKPEDIAAFNIRTAEIVRRVIPDARIAGLSLASSSPKLFENCLRVLADKGKVDLFHWFIYHGYEFNPSKSYPKVEELKAILAKYSTKAKMRQGENGCPSETATKFALSKHPWTEFSQAKWDLRRMLGDLGHDVESAVFTICDFNHTGREINRKGLLHATADKKVDKIKLAYYAVQNCVAVFDDTLERVQDASVVITSDKSTAAFAYRKKSSGQHLVVFWDDSGTPDDAFVTRPAQVSIKGLPIQQPVWVDLVSGRIYEIPADRIAKEGEQVVFKDVPLYDAPVLITEKALIPSLPTP